ncbi:MAG: hypothetical protein JNK72_02540 [Myxococcales bacterium]|nr:hypothetical protein [Myxococcales bacterium]
MERENLEAWLRGLEDFNDFEAGFGDFAGAFEMLPNAAGLEAYVYPLGFHGSGSWIALWRKEPTDSWAHAAMVWIDSEGEPWEPFAATPAEGLAMLALDTGAVYDAAAAARYNPSREDVAAWGPRTAEALAKCLVRYPGQAEHRARLAAAGIALPSNALDIAHAALTAHGSFATWLASRAA